MNILIIGSGGREHALAWKVAQSSQVKKVFVAPGNGGTALENNIENINIDVLDFPQLINFAKEHQIHLTIVGPEAPLAAGIIDAFNEAGLACFGPSQQSAQLEASKQFAKEFMAKHQIPTAAFATFTDIAPAKDYVRQQGTPIVIKADGLAAGKGVIIADNEQEAFAAIDDMLAANKFGAAGNRVVIENFLQGEEASFIVITDGKTIIPFATSQDHKARDDGDKGPNTGGMGAYSPAPVITEALQQRILKEVIEPTVNGMAAAGIPYCGFLYAGLMISDKGDIKVLEYNCRFGDPEAEVILFRMQSDLVELCDAAVNKKLAGAKIAWDPRPCLGVVLAAGGYPNSYHKGDEIFGLDPMENSTCKVFHAGTKFSNQKVLSHGGRVLCVCALGDDIKQAQAHAYAAVKNIHWGNVYYRKDIGYRAIARLA